MPFLPPNLYQPPQQPTFGAGSNSSPGFFQAPTGGTSGNQRTMPNPEFVPGHSFSGSIQQAKPTQPSWTTGGGGFGGFQQGSQEFGAVQGQQQRVNDNFQRAVALLGSPGFGQSQFGQQLMGLFNNPQAFTPQEMQLQRNLLAETETGSRENALRQLEQRATAGGFGDSMSLNDALGRIRTQSGANLNRGYNELALQAADRRNQIRFQAAQLFQQLLGLDQQRAQQLANLWANKVESAIPGLGGSNNAQAQQQQGQQVGAFGGMGGAGASIYG